MAKLVFLTTLIIISQSSVFGLDTISKRRIDAYNFCRIVKKTLNFPSTGDFLKDLTKASSYVNRITSRLRGGIMNEGIYVVETPQGKMLLKVEKSYVTRLGKPHGLVAHKALSEASLAPRLEGYLPPDEMRKLLKKIATHLWLGY